MTFWRRRKDQQVRALAEAEAARKESVDELHAAVLHNQEVRRTTARLRELRTENHFAERFRAAYGRPS